MPVAKKEKPNTKKTKVVNLTPESLMAAMNKKKPGSMKMASDPSLRIKRIPTGILSVDMLLGGGFPRKRFLEIYGSANVGKTYLTLMLIATAQAAGLRCCFVDVEGKFDPAFAKAVGVKLKKLALHEQEHGPGVVNFIETLLRSELYDVIVVDSIASLLPQYEYENELGAGSMGMEQAKLMSVALRKLNAANKKTSVVFINQTREAVGAMMFGKKTLAPGGRAMGHWAVIRIEMVMTETLKRAGQVVDPKTAEIKKGQVVYGHRVLVRVLKDQTGGSLRPNAESGFVFNYEKSRHDHIEDLLLLGRMSGLVINKTVKGTDRWFVEGYEEEAQAGRTRFKKWLRKNRAVQEELEERIRAYKPLELSEDEEPDEDALS